MAHRLDVFQFLCRHVALGADADNHADYFAATERKLNQLSDLGHGFAFIAGLPAIVEATIQRGVEDDLEDALFHELNVIPEEIS